VLGNVVHSQVDIHREFGGVFPAMAKREHQKNLVPVLLKTLNIEPTETINLENSEVATILEKESELLEQFKKYILSLPKPDIDVICVTSGPGLEPALWVGISFAKALGKLWNIPVVPVNHMEGHILSVLVPQQITEQFSFTHDSFTFPALALLISGGHTEMILVKNIGDYTLVGKTRDDAVGEAFDKVARILGLPYPGGPEVSKLALQHDKTAISSITLPRPMIHSKDYDFSFSGLKTAVLYTVRDIKEANAGEIPDNLKTEIAYEFQEAATEVITKKTLAAVSDLGIQTLIIGGGVAANSRIKEFLLKSISEIIPTEQIHFPVRELTGDNALMIGLAGYFKYKKSPSDFQEFENIRANGNLTLE
jgi:N6-L-threonylcarbamoyladenine synthase